MNKPSEPNKHRSTLAIIDILVDTAKHPEKYISDNNYLNSLRSQGGLCHLSIPERHIFPISLNTFKHYCQQFAPGGFSAINRLRLDALEALTNFTPPDNKPRKTQKKLISELQSENSQLTLDLLLLTKLLKISMRQTKFYAEQSGDQNIIELYHKERRELMDMLTCARSNVRSRRIEEAL